ncbi:MAG: ATP-binding cassette domain-containing protein [Armatimonadota bacterium]
MPNIIDVNELKKVFPNRVLAVDSVSFTVAEGEIFGFLGPNGAGKSTTIAILTTLLSPTGGVARVAGYDVVRQPMQVRLHIGYVSQDLAVDDNLTGCGNLRLQAGLYHIPAAEVPGRMADVLRMVDLTDRANDLVETYSGGMRKRLDIACGLIHRPRLLFLDEPTLGLDIQTRREIWRYITQLRAENNMTIFLTTHYMEEADALCDRIAIIDYGQIKALDTPSALKSELGGDRVELEFEAGAPAEIDEAVGEVCALSHVMEVRQTGDRTFQVIVTNGRTVIPEIFAALDGLAARIGAIGMTRPSLDDVFLHYTGRQLREPTVSTGEAMQTRVRMRRMR